MFLIGNISKNLITALEFHQLKWLLIYGSKHVKYWFSHSFTVTLQQLSLLNIWVSWIISGQIRRILCPMLLYFLRKCIKSSKIRPGVLYPLKSSYSQIKASDFTIVWVISMITSILNVDGSVMKCYRVNQFFTFNFHILPIFF